MEKTPIFLHPRKRIELLAHGQTLFNDDQFFEAHESWELLWHMEQGRDKTFIQGLIQVAGHYVLLKKGNWSGAKSLAESAREKLKFPPSIDIYKNLDLIPLLSSLDYNLKILFCDFDSEIPVESFLFAKLFEN